MKIVLRQQCFKICKKSEILNSENFCLNYRLKSMFCEFSFNQNVSVLHGLPLELPKSFGKTFDLNEIFVLLHLHLHYFSNFWALCRPINAATNIVAQRNGPIILSDFAPTGLNICWHGLYLYLKEIFNIFRYFEQMIRPYCYFINRSFRFIFECHKKIINLNIKKPFKKR